MKRQAGELLRAARTAPFIPLSELVGLGPILVLTPHPDDESLGCGGLIAACRNAAVTVEVALLTDGSGSHPGSRTYPPATLAKVREMELRSALAELGVENERLHLLGWPDAAAPADGTDFDLACQQLTDLIGATHAATLFASWSADPHCDHLAAARIAAEAARRTGILVFYYPVWGWTLPEDALVEPGNVWRFDVSEFLERKRRAVLCHRSQLGEVVQDSTAPFRLPEQLLRACLTNSETYFGPSQ